MVSWIIFRFFLGGENRSILFLLIYLTSLFYNFYKNVLGISGLVRSVVFVSLLVFFFVCVDDWMANDY